MRFEMGFLATRLECAGAAVTRDVCAAQELTKSVRAGAKIVVCCSGRGDKDVHTAMRCFDGDGNVKSNLESLT